MYTQPESKLDTFCLLADVLLQVSHGIEDTQAQSVLLVGRHLHAPGDSQSTPGVHHLRVGRYVHQSVDDFGTHLLIRTDHVPVALRGRAGPESLVESTRSQNMHGELAAFGVCGARCAWWRGDLHRLALRALR